MKNKQKTSLLGVEIFGKKKYGNNIKYNGLKSKAFTLVELIVSIVILTILATIGFISLIGFTGQARDTSRIQDLKNIEESIVLYQAHNGEFPEPENYETKTISGVVWKIGTFGNKAFKKVKNLGKLPIDPETGSGYLYMVSESGLSYKLEAKLEKDLANNPNIDKKIFLLSNYKKSLGKKDIKCRNGQENYNGVCLTPTSEDCFTMNNDKNYYFYGLCKKYDCKEKNIIIPHYFKGEPVTRIARGVDGVCFGIGLIDSVYIPDTVTSIGDFPFGIGKIDITNTDGFTSEYLYLPKGEGIEIVGYYGDEIDISIPEYINAKKVISIQNQAFSLRWSKKYKSNLTSVTIPNSVTSIGYRAFSRNKLTSVINYDGNNSEYLYLQKGEGIEILDYFGKASNLSIPEYINGQKVTSIGDGAFSNNQLTGVTIPNSVTSIGYRAFSNNKLTSITIPNSVTSIGNDAFSNNKLTSVTIPNSVTSIGNWAFYYNNLTSVTILNSVISIGNDAFSLNKLTSVTNYDGNNSEYLYLPKLGGIEISDYFGKVSNLSIPEYINGQKVISIGERAFFGNQLTSVTIPNSVINIGNKAFFMNKLKSVTIPNSVTSIGNDAFKVTYGSENITDWTPGNGGTWKYNGNWVKQ